MPDDFVIARNPETDSSLPYLLRVPIEGRPILLKAREPWPRTSKVYCHRFDAWPDEVEIVERVPVRSCVRRGAAIDLVLDRGRENRSQFVITQARGRQMVFWQTARTSKQARPRAAVPTARASGVPRLDIVVDSHERYSWKFDGQQATTRRAGLVAGDYGVLDQGRLVAVVERKSLDDLVTSLTTGKLKYQLADLAVIPRSAVVVEERYSRAFQHEIVRGSVIADGLAEGQVAFPTVPIVFCENRKFSQEWTYRFLAAALSAGIEETAANEALDGFATAPALPPRTPTPAEIREWALDTGVAVSDRGRIPVAVVRAFEAAHGR